MVVRTDDIAKEEAPRRRRPVGVRTAVAVLAVLVVIGAVAALGGFSSGPSPASAPVLAPGPPTLPRLDALASVVTSGSSPVRGPWRLSASVDHGLVCAQLDFASSRNEAPHVSGCSNAAAAAGTSGVLVTSAGTIGVVGIATVDVASVKALTSDGQTATTSTVDGRAGFGVDFFAFPDLGISSGPTVYVAYDAGGEELGQIGSRTGARAPSPPPTAKPAALDNSPPRRWPGVKTGPAGADIRCGHGSRTGRRHGAGSGGDGVDARARPRCGHDRHD